MTWLLSQIPLWVYVSVTLLACAAAFWFLHPILIPLWAVTPRWLKAVLIGIAALCAAFVAGLTKGGRAAKERQKQLEAKSVAKREEIHRDVEKRDSTTIDRDFDKWVR